MLVTVGDDAGAIDASHRHVQESAENKTRLVRSLLKDLAAIVVQS